MVTDFNSPIFVLTAVKRIYDVLPELIGADWETVKPQVDTYIRALEAKNDDFLSYTLLFGLLAQYEAARQRLTEELIVQSTIAGNLDNPELDEKMLAIIMGGLTWDVDSETVPSAEESQRTTRSMTLKDGGADGAKLLKFKNLDLDLGKMLTIGAGFFMTANEMLDKQTPFIIAGGILLMVGTLLSQMTVKIEQQEATVFWGLIVTTNKTTNDRKASTEQIFRMTNVERQKRGLPDLSDEQFKHSLYKLEQLGSIVRVDEDSYRIIESFRVKR
jgi:hypothetical protein